MNSSRKPLVYVAGPFFSDSQRMFIQDIEYCVEHSGWDMFSPRLGPNAIELNRELKERGTPSRKLAFDTFTDNIDNIEDADLLVAVIDDFDTGTMFEMGYAYRAHVPIVSITRRDYGVNLMLRWSIVGHVKSVSALADVLRIGNPGLSRDKGMDEYGETIARIAYKYQSDQALCEGPGETIQ